MLLRIEGLNRPAPVAITVFGREVQAYPGESLAAALIAAGELRFGDGLSPDRPRLAFCHMGVCQQCLVRVGGRLVQACLTPVAAGQVIT
ncbi:(2Fe-2S)-binding protein [Humitalea sp. 24SJ18S-53]|uniref:(2Fe-2S)-binding protein n=1 Tax=Humitalea sp. 24SJ18S-53 TaxID=3422307 RepID=UPI003D676242